MKMGKQIIMGLALGIAAVAGTFNKANAQAPSKANDIMTVTSVDKNVVGYSYSFGNKNSYDVMEYTAADHHLKIKQGVHNVNIEGMGNIETADKETEIDLDKHPELKAKLNAFASVAQSMANHAKPGANDELNITGGLTEVKQNFSATGALDLQARKIEGLALLAAKK